MDMMGMIGHLTVYTVQEISVEDREGSGLGALLGWIGWLHVLHMLAYMFD